MSVIGWTRAALTVETGNWLPLHRMAVPRKVRVEFAMPLSVKHAATTFGPGHSARAGIKNGDARMQAGMEALMAFQWLKDFDTKPVGKLIGVGVATARDEEVPHDA